MEEKHCNCHEECNCTEDVKFTEDCHCGEHKEHECHCNHDKKKYKEEKHKYKEKIEQLKEELKKKDQEVLVARADLINYRKRKDEEVVRMLKFCNEDLIKQILPIMDNFERAIKLDDDNLDDEVSKFLEGFKLMYKQLRDLLERFEVKEIDALDKEFDPATSQAVVVDNDESKDSGVVLEVFQKGYMYKDRVLRTAMVKVNE